jgi:hypothetical protein
MSKLQVSDMLAQAFAAEGARLVAFPEDLKVEVRRANAVGLGVDHFDSSDMYGWGHNETLLGKALSGGRRAKVVLATKFGQTQRPGGANAVDGSPAYVKAACEASLKRLGVDEIDLYFQHRVDPSVPIEETVGAMAEPGAAAMGPDSWRSPSWRRLQIEIGCSGLHVSRSPRPRVGYDYTASSG